MLEVGDVVYAKKVRQFSADPKNWVEHTMGKDEFLLTVAIDIVSPKEQKAKPVMDTVFAKLEDIGIVTMEAVEKVVGPELARDIYDAILEDRK